jgi:hypothetical protein
MNARSVTSQLSRAGMFRQPSRCCSSVGLTLLAGLFLDGCSAAVYYSILVGGVLIPSVPSGTFVGARRPPVVVVVVSLASYANNYISMF